MEREPKPKKIYEVDLTVPVDTSVFPPTEDCFGKEWDLTTQECTQCAERDLCGLLFRDRVDKKAQKQEADSGVFYLDTCDFNIDTDALLATIESGVTTVAELLATVAKMARTSDMAAVKQWLKRWHAAEGKIKTKGGIVWLP